MSHLVNVIKKELRELLTPGSVISVLVMVMLFAGLGGLIGGEVDKAKALPVFGVANWEDGDVVLDDGTEWDAYSYFYTIYENAGVPAEEIGNYVKKVEMTGDIHEVMTENEISALIVLQDGFGETIESIMSGAVGAYKPAVYQYYLYEPTGMFGSVSSTTVSSLVASMSDNLSAFLIKSSIEDKSQYSFLSHPFYYGDEYLNTVVNGKECSGVTPQAIASAVSSSTMMIPIIIMIIIMMVGSIVISSMGSEKENKTLETLLTLPIRRTSIVTGKIIAAAIVGLVYGAAYMVGMSFYMTNMMNPLTSVGGDVSLADIGIVLTMTDYAILMLSMFLAIVCALGICMILGAFAKNYKSAQTMTMPMSILSMLPMFVIMFSGWYGSGMIIKAVTFAIPFSHPMIAVQSLMFGDYTLVFAGIAYMAVFAAISILITVRLYSSDILITGLGQSKAVQRFKKGRWAVAAGCGRYQENYSPGEPLSYPRGVLPYDSMNKMLIAIVAAVIVIAAAGAAVVLMKDDGKDTKDVTNGSQLNVQDNMASYLFDLYLGQNGSSEKTLINSKGMYDIPSDAIIIVSAKNPTGPLVIQDKYIAIPTEDGNQFVSVGFQNATKDATTIADASTAYVAFTPSAGTVNLGVFVTNYP
jgi:ABC-2 type transport system permease protein